MNPFYLLLLTIPFMTVSLSNNSGAFILEKSQLLDYLPSGSAMTIINDTIYIAGDDSPHLFELNPLWEFREKYLLLNHFSAYQRIPKPIKPDFESLASEETTEGNKLYLFGSGSKSPERDLVVQVSLPQPALILEFSMQSFYARIVEHNGGAAESLNLEGAFISDHKIYFLNRAGNQLISVALNEFKEYLAGRMLADELSLSFVSFRLPARGNVQAGFSGACPIPGTSKLIFTATLENTDNWIDDGEILGSYLGILDLKSPDKGEPEYIEFITAKEEPFADKLESVAFNGTYVNGDGKLLAIADNDDGSTRLFEFRLRKDYFERSTSK
jgi:hypothetical protein